MQTRLTVLKFGSSVLHSPAELPVAVHEIYGELREHRRVIAAVSAFEGVTDRLFAEASGLGLDTDPHAVAAHVATGEQEAAAQLVKALAEAGVPAAMIDPRDFSFCAQGDPLDASPCGVDIAVLEARFKQTPVLVVPGYYAADREGRIVLLGRGGTDLTALYLARNLNASCRLVKDVDGIYEHDPASSKVLPPRFERVSWEHALQVGGKLVQPRAIRFAQQHGQTFGVGAAGNVQTTLVGPGPDTFKALPHLTPLRVVLLGLGTVGLGVYRYLRKRPDLFDVRRIVVRDPSKPREEVIPAGLLSSNVQDAAEVPADLVIEAIGGVEPAAHTIHTALLKGRAVVTANKAMIAARWREFAPFVAGPDRRLRFSAAVGGALPVLETLEALLSHDRIERVRAVINGTCNFILDALADGGSFAEAVKQAQVRGFAEADPRSDLSGEDAAFKLGIISSIAFGADLDLDGIERTGIEQITAQAVADVRQRDRSLRLVATVERTDAEAMPALRLSVQPCELAADDFLAGACNEENRVEIFTAGGECVRLAGKGAGRWPTAVAVLGDVYAQVRQARARLAAATASARTVNA